MSILSFISSRLEFWSVNHTSIHENSELKVFENAKFSGYIFYNWPNNLLGTIAYKTLEFCDNHCWQYYNELIQLQYFTNEKRFLIYIFSYLVFSAST